MNMKIKNTDMVFILFLCLILPLFYFFLKTDLFKNLSSDIGIILCRTAVIFFFTLAIALNYLIKNKQFSFGLLFVCTLTGFVLLPQSIFMFAPLAAVLWGIDIVRSGKPKELCALAFFVPTLAIAAGAYLLKIRRFGSFLALDAEEKMLLCFITGAVCVVFALLYLLLHLASKKPADKKTAKRQKKRSGKQSTSGLALVFATLTVLVFCTFLTDALIERFFGEMYWIALGAWGILALYLFFLYNPACKRLLKWF